MRPFDSIPQYFEPQEEEGKRYQAWLDSGAFTPHREPGQKTFSIVMPPPNITGQLHMGHALDLSMQDIATRYHRMLGEATLYLPGTDHASIATEAKVVEKLRSEGKDKREIGREAFLEEAWAWNDVYGSRIVEQTKRLGISCDWSRQRFTLDEGLSEAVLEAFIDLYKKGLIYRGERMINWCSNCGTSISDAEIDHEERDAKFYYVRYPLGEEPDRYLEIATTRPETMLGDTAIAVHPDDERYTHLVGKYAILPLVNRMIPIVADAYVDPEFGTGCVKITPAHDPNDFEIGQRHDLEIIDVITDDGHINELGGEYEGLSIMEAREKIVKDLDKQGYLIKVEELKHNLGLCSRCNEVIEPKLSLQWWVKMKPLAEPAIKAVKEGKIEFIPERFVTTYLNWMENIRDWCISRQLWWGHRIPAWYCDDCDHITVARETPDKCENCGSTHIHQDEDTLDTWFSSALWPFSTLGWPHETEDLKNYYPTSLLITGYDILPLWVSRMIFSGIEYTGQIPFHRVGYHGLVRDEIGRKMSKSLGNGIDPLDIIDQSGADALRYALFWGTSAGNDLRFSDQKVEAGRNFINKLWNALRFLRMNLDDQEDAASMDIQTIKEDELKLEDRWLLTELETLIEETTRHYDRLEFSLALEKINRVAWDGYCDWYVEISKQRLRSDDKEDALVTKKLMNHALVTFAKLLHPVMPYFTEALYEELYHAPGMLIEAAWPELRGIQYPEEQKAMEEMINAIRGIRNARAELDLKPDRTVDLLMTVDDDQLAERFLSNLPMLERLARVASIERIHDKDDVPANSVSIPLPRLALHMPLEGLIDWAAEKERLLQEKAEAEKLIAGQEKKLANENFTSRAPEKVVQGERDKLAKYQALLAQTLDSLSKIPEEA